MLQVLYAKQKVGNLWSQERELYFQYELDWLQDTNTFALTPQLPLNTEIWRGEVVLAFFSNLLPEGAVLDTILKLKRLPRGDIYAQLAAFGEDAAGAFSIVAEGELRQRQADYQAYPLTTIRADINKQANHIPLLLQHGELRLSLAGAQDKIPVYYAAGEFALPRGGAASTHILKPALQPESLFPDAVLNEALCLNLAQYCGLDAVSAEVIYLPEPVLLIERYDRVIHQQPVQRLHQLDFCQLSGVLPDQKYTKDGGPNLADVFRLIDQYASVPARDRLKVLDWVIFNYLVGNADAHAKNLAMLLTAGNKMQLAPIYDVLCTAIYPNLDTRMAMPIGGEYRPAWVQQRHWQRFAEESNINMALLNKRGLALAKRVQAGLAPALAALSMANDKLALNLEKLVHERARWLEGRLGI